MLRPLTLLLTLDIYLSLPLRASITLLLNQRVTLLKILLSSGSMEVLVAHPCLVSCRRMDLESSTMVRHKSRTTLTLGTLKLMSSGSRVLLVLVTPLLELIRTLRLTICFNLKTLLQLSSSGTESSLNSRQTSYLSLERVMLESTSLTLLGKSTRTISRLNSILLCTTSR